MLFVIVSCFQTTTQANTDFGPVTSTEKYRISRKELGYILGRNLRGLKKLWNIEINDALNVSSNGNRQFSLVDIFIVVVSVFHFSNLNTTLKNIAVKRPGHSIHTRSRSFRRRQTALLNRRDEQILPTHRTEKPNSPTIFVLCSSELISLIIHSIFSLKNLQCYHSVTHFIAFNTQTCSCFPFLAQIFIH